MCPPCRLHGHSNRAASLLLQVSFKLILKMFEKHVMILFQDNAHLSSVCTDDFFDEAVIKVFILLFSAAVIYASYAES